jgi:hypothetical protein
MNALELLLRRLGDSLLLPLVFFLPLAALGWVLHSKRKRYKAEAHEPFTQLPLRPPGESLREHLEKLAEDYDHHVTTAALAMVCAALVVGTTPRAQQFWVGVVLFVIVCGFTLWSGTKAIVLVRKIWDYRLGFAGERVVGEELNQLLASGFRVFHDVPFDGFNIDHVVVGPLGVFAVETKTRRKPADLRGKEKATVEVFGDVLEFPHGREEKAVPQARLNAKTLGEWLTKATGETVIVSAIVTLPGWWVNRRQVHDVNVLNPQEIKRSFPSRPRYPLTPEQMQRIVHQLTERCRMIVK